MFYSLWKVLSGEPCNIYDELQVFGFELFPEIKKTAVKAALLKSFLEILT